MFFTPWLVYPLLEESDDGFRPFFYNTGSFGVGTDRNGVVIIGFLFPRLPFLRGSGNGKLLGTVEQGRISGHGRVEHQPVRLSHKRLIGRKEGFCFCEKLFVLVLNGYLKISPPEAKPDICLVE